MVTHYRSPAFSIPGPVATTGSTEIPHAIIGKEPRKNIVKPRTKSPGTNPVAGAVIGSTSEPEPGINRSNHLRPAGDTPGVLSVTEGTSVPPTEVIPTVATPPGRNKASKCPYSVLIRSIGSGVMTLVRRTSAVNVRT